jgi:hypothetical protein
MNLKPVIIWGIALLFCVQFVGELGIFDSPPFHQRLDNPHLPLLCLAKCAVVLIVAYLVHWMVRKKSNPN